MNNLQDNSRSEIVERSNNLRVASLSLWCAIGIFVFSLFVALPLDGSVVSQVSGDCQSSLSQSQPGEPGYVDCKDKSKWSCGGLSLGLLVRDGLCIAGLLVLLSWYLKSRGAFISDNGIRAITGGVIGIGISWIAIAVMLFFLIMSFSFVKSGS